MSLYEIKGFKCEWCGQIFETDRNYHDTECKHDPKARTCVSCVYTTECTSCQVKELHGVVYCPRANQVFKYPHDRYCPDYKKNPEFESYKPKE
jgi:uncharacterized C2H2 Zn-finger protein